MRRVHSGRHRRAHLPVVVSPVTVHRVGQHAVRSGGHAHKAAFAVHANNAFRVSDRGQLVALFQGPVPEHAVLVGAKADDLLLVAHDAGLPATGGDHGYAGQPVHQPRGALRVAVVPRGAVKVARHRPLIAAPARKLEVFVDHRAAVAEGAGYLLDVARDHDRQRDVRLDVHARLVKVVAPPAPELGEPVDRANSLLRDTKVPHHLKVRDELRVQHVPGRLALIGKHRVTGISPTVERHGVALHAARQVHADLDLGKPKLAVRDQHGRGAVGGRAVAEHAGVSGAPAVGEPVAVQRAVSVSAASKLLDPREPGNGHRGDRLTPARVGAQLAVRVLAPARHGLVRGDGAGVIPTGANGVPVKNCPARGVDRLDRLSEKLFIVE